MATAEEYLASQAAKKGKGAKQKNKGRKIGRNFRWDGTLHTMTKYRAEGRRSINKARRAAQRARWLQHRKERHAVYLKEHGRFEVNEVPESTGSGPSKREDQGR